jgi:hypothetical protein
MRPYRWFWYVSLPKLNALEAQGGSHFPLADKLSLSLGALGTNIKASLRLSSVKPTRRLNRRLDRIESKLIQDTSLPEVKIAFSLKPTFFQFNGAAGRFIQGGFHRKKTKADGPGEDFYPQGGFVACGHDDDTAVLLVGNANNMYSSGDSSVMVSIFSQYPLIMLLQNGERPTREDYLTSSFETVLGHIREVPPFSRIKAVGIYGSGFTLSHPVYFPDGAKVTKVLIGSPLYIEQV